MKKIAPIIENLIDEELKKLIDYKNKIFKKILGISIFSLIVFVTIFLIPMKYLPIKYLHINKNTKDLNVNFFEQLGIVPSLVIIIFIVVLMLIMAYFYYRYPKLSRDIKEQKKVRLQVTITKIEKPSSGLEQIDVSFRPSYKGTDKIHFIEKIDLSAFKVGQTVQVIATENAFYPLYIG